jgi:hypothetical protein
MCRFSKSKQGEFYANPIKLIKHRSPIYVIEPGGCGQNAAGPVALATKSEEERITD